MTDWFLAPRTESGGGHYPFLLLISCLIAGYVTLAYMWLRIEAEAYKQLAEKAEDAAFYQSKIATAQFYYARFLPRTKGYAALLAGGSPKELANLNVHSAAMVA